MDEMKYLTELAVRDYYFSTKRTSTIALAAIFNVIGDTNDRLEELLKPFLRVIMGRFDFDHHNQVAAAIKRLQFLSKLPELLDDTDERSLDLDDSVKTRKVSNTSTPMSERDFDLEGHSLFCYQRDVSRKCTMNHARHLYVTSPVWSDQDLYDLSYANLTTSTSRLWSNK